MDDLMNETVPADASTGVFGRIGNPQVSDDVLLKYIHHPEYALRSSAMDKVVQYNRDHLIVPLMKSTDPRLRHAGVMALAGMFKGKALPNDRITPEMFELVGQMIEDPDESWWVTIAAMNGLARANPQTIAKHVDRLMVLLASENWWVSSTAAKPLMVLATDVAYHQRVLPKVLETIAQSPTPAGINNVYSLTKRMGSAKPAVKQFAAGRLMEIYAAIPGEYKEPSNQIRPSPARRLMSVSRWPTVADPIARWRNLPRHPAEDDPGCQTQRPRSRHVHLPRQVHPQQANARPMGQHRRHATDPTREMGRRLEEARLAGGQIRLLVPTARRRPHQGGNLPQEDGPGVFLDR
jgi:hypothetical protein